VKFLKEENLMINLSYFFLPKKKKKKKKKAYDTVPIYNKTKNLNNIGIRG